jgi:hypothetical protein
MSAAYCSALASLQLALPSLGPRVLTIDGVGNIRPRPSIRWSLENFQSERATISVPPMRRSGFKRLSRLQPANKAAACTAPRQLPSSLP